MLNGVLRCLATSQPNCAALAAHLRELQAASRTPLAGPHMVLLSGHDTTLLMLLNALDAEGARVSFAEWPPHTSHITLELREDDTVRVLYGGGAAQIVEPGPAATLLERLDKLAIGEDEYVRLCEQRQGGARPSFSWAD